MKEINNSLTNSPRLVPWRLASATLWISGMKGSQESLFLQRHEKIMRSEIGRYSEGDVGRWGLVMKCRVAEGGSNCCRYETRSVK